MTKGIDKYPLLLIFTSLILLSSCNSNVMFTETLDMADKNWELMNIPVFDVPVDDTLTSFDVFFTIRTGSSYPFRNIFFFVTTTAPDGDILSDTLQYFLADEKGKWYGKGFGDIHELKLPFRSNVYFPMKGTYQFRIQHGMRIEDLKGVYDVGLRVEKTSK
jgi:gliding motility-associated lipoprotein GldH